MQRLHQVKVNPPSSPRTLALSGWQHLSSGHRTGLLCFDLCERPSSIPPSSPLLSPHLLRLSSNISLHRTPVLPHISYSLHPTPCKSPRSILKPGPLLGNRFEQTRVLHLPPVLREEGKKRRMRKWRGCIKSEK